MNIRCPNRVISLLWQKFVRAYFGASRQPRRKRRPRPEVIAQHSKKGADATAGGEAAEAEADATAGDEVAEAEADATAGDEVAEAKADATAGDEAAEAKKDETPEAGGAVEAAPASGDSKAEEADEGS